MVRNTTTLPSYSWTKRFSGATENIRGGTEREFYSKSQRPGAQADGIYQFYTVAYDTAGGHEVKSAPEAGIILESSIPSSRVLVFSESNTDNPEISVAYTVSPDPDGPGIEKVELYRRFTSTSGDSDVWILLDTAADSLDTPFLVQGTNDGYYEFYTVAYDAASHFELNAATTEAGITLSRATPTPSGSDTPTPSSTETETGTPSRTDTPTDTASPTASVNGTPTDTNTFTPTVSPTATATATITPTNTRTPTKSVTSTRTRKPIRTGKPTKTMKPTKTQKPSRTNTPGTTRTSWMTRITGIQTATGINERFHYCLHKRQSARFIVRE